MRKPKLKTKRAKKIDPEKRPYWADAVREAEAAMRKAGRGRKKKFPRAVVEAVALRIEKWMRICEKHMISSRSFQHLLEECGAAVEKVPHYRRDPMFRSARFREAVAFESIPIKVHKLANTAQQVVDSLDGVMGR